MEKMWARALSVLLGIWLMVAPGLLDYFGPARTNDHVVGPLTAAFSVIAIWEVMRPLRRVTLALGLWLVVAPWVLRYPDWAMVGNDAGVGLAVIALSLVPGEVRHRFGGGWSALWRDGPPATGDRKGSMLGG